MLINSIIKFSEKTDESSPLVIDYSTLLDFLLNLTQPGSPLFENIKKSCLFVFSTKATEKRKITDMSKGLDFRKALFNDEIVSRVISEVLRAHVIDILNNVATVSVKGSRTVYTIDDLKSLEYFAVLLVKKYINKLVNYGVLQNVFFINDPEKPTDVVVDYDTLISSSPIDITTGTKIVESGIYSKSLERIFNSRSFKELVSAIIDISNSEDILKFQRIIDTRYDSIYLFKNKTVLVDKYRESFIRQLLQNLNLGKNISFVLFDAIVTYAKDKLKEELKDVTNIWQVLRSKKEAFLNEFSEEEFYSYLYKSFFKLYESRQRQVAPQPIPETEKGTQIDVPYVQTFSEEPSEIIKQSIEELSKKLTSLIKNTAINYFSELGKFNSQITKDIADAITKAITKDNKVQYRLRQDYGESYLMISTNIVLKEINNIKENILNEIKSRKEVDVDSLIELITSSLRRSKLAAVLEEAIFDKIVTEPIIINFSNIIKTNISTNIKKWIEEILQKNEYFKRWLQEGESKFSIIFDNLKAILEYLKISEYIENKDLNYIILKQIKQTKGSNKSKY